MKKSERAEKMTISKKILTKFNVKKVNQLGGYDNAPNCSFTTLTSRAM
jgi:hypothetical protein